MKITRLKSIHALFLSLIFLINCKEDEIIPIPDAPTNLVATIISETQIDLTWNDNSSNETNFIIERKSGSDEFIELARTAQDVTTYSNKNLDQNTSYTYRVYAINVNNEISAMSNEVSATTKGVPTVSTTSVSSIMTFTAMGGGEITNDGGSSIASKGIVWSITQNPTIDLNTKTDEGSGSEIFTSSIIDLEWETTYYVRAYATNESGTSYGDEVSFQTSELELSTTFISDITLISATSGGSIAAEGGSSITSKGIVWSTNPNPTIDLSTKTEDGMGSGTFASNISGLDWGTTYYVRAYATNSSKTQYGNELTLTTLPIEITTNTITDIGIVTAKSGGTTSGETGNSMISRGIVWDVNPNPTIDLTTKIEDVTLTGSFDSFISDLSPGTIYYVRSYASNNSRVDYGNELSFTSANSIDDLAGNNYMVVQIGDQIWFQDNLRTDIYSDGESIINISDNTTWNQSTSGAYTWYNNDEANNNLTYGALYNGYAVITDKLCPTGWHVPSEDEWLELANYVGGESVAGGKLKETGTTNWSDPNVGATDEYGFTARPGGYRWTDGNFNEINTTGTFWTPTESTFTPGNFRIVGFGNVDNNIMRPSYPQNYGASVRCLFDSN